MAQLDERAQAILTGVRQDYQSGATQLALRTLTELLAYLDHERPEDHRLARLIGELRAARPSMIVISNALDLVSKRWTKEPGQPRQAVARVLAQLESASATIAGHARGQLPDNAVVMTHSASSVVLALFRQMADAGRPFSVTCTQSSPGFEGHTLARTLNDLAIPVTLITDAQMGLFVGRADVVISGCDAWLADDYFVNKSGTRLLALAARDAGKPFLVLADSFRNSDARHHSVSLEEMPAAELAAPEGRYISPRNVYFETVPPYLVSARISERGVFSFPAGPPR